MSRLPIIQTDTSIHVRRLIESDDEASWVWIVARLTPYLEMQARYRLRGVTLRLHDPSDLLNDVWVRAYPRLRDLRSREGHITPVLLRFLGQTLLNRINELLRQQVRRGLASPFSRSDSNSGAHNGVPEPADERWRTVSQQAAHSEMHVRLQSALSKLDATDQEVLVLRGIEQVPNHRAAAGLGVRPGTLAMRYKRAKVRLREQLPASWIDDVF